MRAAGLRSGLLGTTGAQVDGEPVALDRTTPEAPDLHRLLARMRAAGVGTVVMEVSSHAMAQHRVDGVVFDLAVFTNLTQDHLDYHGSMESYFAAKAALFTPAHAARALIGIDDPWGRRLVEAATIPVTTYAVDRDADLRATEIHADAAGSTVPPGRGRGSHHAAGRVQRPERRRRSRGRALDRHRSSHRRRRDRRPHRDPRPDGGDRSGARVPGGCGLRPHAG